MTHVTHIDFTNPYTSDLRNEIIAVANANGISVNQTGVYGCTQGPRLESAAEIKRLAQDGCDIVGMTGMPEAALAKELEIAYANISVVANWGAGIVDGEITMAEIEFNLQSGMQQAINLLDKFIASSTDQK